MEAELIGEVGPVDIIARILGVEVGLGHLVVVVGSSGRPSHSPPADGIKTNDGLHNNER